MATTHHIEWTIERGEDDAFDIWVEYTFTAGAPAHYGSLSYPGHPAEPAEVEIVGAWRDPASPTDPVPDFNLTDEEREKIEVWILENPPEPQYREDD